jgi:hypothetical protein
LLLAVLIGAYMPGRATAAESVSLHATLTPERLGQGTTIGFALESPHRLVRPPLH